MITRTCIAFWLSCFMQLAQAESGKEAQLPASTPPISEGREFAVYFDIGEHKLSPSSRAIVRDAANHARQNGTSKILVVGHTDSSGSPEVNLRLSRQRAEAVVHALEESGILPGIIEVDWKGEFEPKIPTDSDSTEAGNRRVTIILDG